MITWIESAIVHFAYTNLKNISLTLISTTGERINLFNRSSNLFAKASRASQITTDTVSSNSTRKP